jgi:hypothetical protein
MAPGEVKGIWVEWVVGTDTTAVNDEMTIAVRGETAA